ncbi:MAG: DUF3459 domain-containing protein, partial [Oscillibacter sp.]|nr:DUF3459 domain-containing protein [Oscillibacter sp.]
YRSINVETEERDPDSVLNYYRALIQLRKRYPIIAEGEIRFLDTGNARVYAYERSLGAQRLTVVCNFSGEGQSVTVAMPTGEVLLSSYGDATPDGQSLRPYEAFAVLS